MAARPPPPDTTTPLVPSTFDEHHLPSVLHKQHPMTPESERSTRRRTVRFIEEAGQRSLKLPRVAIATATVFFHRFYAKHCFQEHDRFEVAMACLLLAGKTEESPKKLDVVVRECWKLRRRAAQQSVSMGETNSPPSMASSSPPTTTTTEVSSLFVDANSEEYIQLKERVLLFERVILHTIGFELDISHPYKYLAECVQNLNNKRLLEYAIPPSKEGVKNVNSQLFQDLFQYAMNFANDSMHTSLCLQFSSSQIAMACVYLSAKYSNIRPVGGKQFVDLLEGMTVQDLTCICVQILELIQPNKKGMESEVALKRVRRELERLEEGGSGEAPREKKAKTS